MSLKKRWKELENFVKKEEKNLSDDIKQVEKSAAKIEKLATDLIKKEKEIMKKEKNSLSDSIMWAKKDNRDVGAVHSGYQVKYAKKDGNYVEWLVDGEKAYYEMCDAFCKSTKFIYLIAAYFSPGINLARGTDYVALSNKYPEIIKKVKDLNRSKGVNENTIPLVSLLAVKAEMGIPVRIVMFYPDLAQEKLGSVFDTDQAYTMVRNWSRKIDIQKAMWGGSYEGHEIGSHHMKSAISGTDEGLIGFCGGVDMAYARWALQTHNLDADPLDIKKNTDPLLNLLSDQKGWIDPSKVLGEWNGKDYDRKGSQVLWHDVHAKVIGPAAYDLADNFADRYLNAKTRNSKPNLPKNKNIRKEFLYDHKNMVSSQQLNAAQILRSYYQWNGGNSGDYGIWDAYRNMFRKAKTSIYIENQYAFEDSKLKNILEYNIENNKNLKVIIVAPVMPDNYDDDILSNLKDLIDASLAKHRKYDTARVAVFSLVSKYGRRRIPIYTHAKVAVIDDEWSMVGSANLDRMGMGGKGGGWGSRGSSELGILVHGKDNALDLRNRLVAEHLGTISPPNNFENVFRDFVKTATGNKRIKDSGPLTGHLVWHRIYDHIPTPA